MDIDTQHTTMNDDDSWEEDWETADVTLAVSAINQIQLENRQKVIESDMENARNIFADEEEDQTLLELEAIAKAKKTVKKIVTMPTVKKEKRVMSEEEIERREIQAEEKKERERVRKSKKNAKKRMSDVFGEPDDVEHDRYADFESKYY